MRRLHGMHDADAAQPLTRALTRANFFNCWCRVRRQSAPPCASPFQPHMSIRIGVDQAAVTNRERIVLQSASQSNMVTLSTPLSEANIVFGCNLYVGRRDTALGIGMGTQPFAVFGACNTTFHRPVVFAESLAAAGTVAAQDLAASRGVVAGQMLASNVVIRSSNYNSPFLQAFDPLGAPILEAYGQGLLTWDGRVGIGTDDPDQAHALHVAGGSIRADGAVLSSESVTGKVTSAQGHQIDLSSPTGIIMRSDTTVTGDLYVGGAFNFNASGANNFVVSNRLTSSHLMLSNTHTQEPTFNVLHRGASNLAASVRVRDAADQLQGCFAIDADGRLGVGTHVTSAQLTVQHAPWSGAATNLLLAVSCNMHPALCVSSPGFVGIGTGSPIHHMHIEIDAVAVTSNLASNLTSSNLASNALVGIYNNTIPIDTLDQDLNPITLFSTPPTLAAFSNGSPVALLSADGRLALQSSTLVDGWGICADGINSTRLRTTEIDAGDAATITFANTQLSNVAALHTCNLVATQLTSTSNLITNFFFASNYSIPGLDCMNTYGYFSVSLPTYLTTASNVLFASDTSGFGDSNLGRVRIYNDPAQQATADVVGLHVTGASNTLVRVSSQRAAALQLSRGASPDQTPTASARLEVDASSLFRLGYSPYQNLTVAPLTVSSLGLRMNNAVQFSPVGRVGISLGGTDLSPTLPDYALHTRGSVSFDAVGGCNVLFVNEVSSFLGVGTRAPAHKLHVVGSMFASSNAVVAGSVGVGTDVVPLTYRMHVNGDLNIDGNIMQRGAPFVSERIWANVTGSTVYTTCNLVGIGTAAPTPGNALHVHGMTLLGSNVSVRGTVSADTGFVGSGALLSNINATSLTSGTVQAARLPVATTSQSGIVQLSDATDSTSTTLASTANALRQVHELASRGGMPTGCIMMHAAASAPDGWLVCDGQEVSRTAYAALFVVISTSYGSGNGLTTFNVPDFRARMPAGMHSGDSDFNTIGKTGGSKSTSLALGSGVGGGTGGSTTFSATGTTSGSSNVVGYGLRLGAGAGLNNQSPYITTVFIIKT